MEGDALVDFVVDPSGHVRQAKAVNASRPLSAEEAVRAVRQWLYSPGQRSGRPVFAHFQVPVNFWVHRSDTRARDGMVKFQ